jgi:peptidoglycan/LPS O-acetylase OafA/YrhL
VQWLATLLFGTAPVAYWLLPPSLGWIGVSTPSLIVFLAAMMAEVAGMPLNLPFIDRLGDWSYGIYLVHVPIIDAVSRHLPDFWTGHNSLVGFGALCLAAFALSGATFYCVEKPCMRLARKLTRRPKNR